MDRLHDLTSSAQASKTLKVAEELGLDRWGHLQKAVKVLQADNGRGPHGSSGLNKEKLVNL